MAERVSDDELFAYAAGELDSAARALLAERVASDAALRARLAWYRAVCDATVDTLPPLDGLPSADAVVQRLRSGSGRGGFFAWLGGRALKPVATLAALAIAGQAVIIAMLALERSETAAMRSSGAPQGSVVLVVAFDPETREAAMRALLLEAGATIIRGPRQLGEYRIAVPANRVEYARSLLRQSGMVEYVREEKP